MLKENPYPGEAHSLARQVLIEKMLSPASSNWLIDRADGTTQVVMEKMPMRDGEGLVPADYDDEKGKVVVEKALSGDADADAALCEIAFQHILRRRPLPIHLAGYIGALLRLRFKRPPKRRKGRYSPHQNTIRDFVIVRAVASLEEMGIDATRNRAKRIKYPDTKLSGCAIIAKALAQMGLHIDEGGVDTIWSRRQDIRLKSL
jgi:hypothetical protein